MLYRRHPNGKSISQNRLSGRKKQRGAAYKHIAKYMPPLLLLTALLTGCTPEEKTLLLPLADSSESDMEMEATGKDYTVKKIYTYTYDTLELLGKSAFLSSCGKNEVHILSLGGEDSKMLEYRQVDYRYGFYDVIGEFWKQEEDWSKPYGGEMEGDLYIEQLLPSPDGKQLLVYLRSAFWDRMLVQLYTLGESSPLVLYDGTADVAGFFRGGFSPSGRWVTFDASALSTGSTGLVPIYDCSQIMSQSSSGEEDDGTSWEQSQDGTAPGDYWPIDSSKLLAPDQVLYAPDLLHANEKLRSSLWDTGLYDNGDNPGLVSLIKEEDSEALYIREDVFLPGETIAPSFSLIEEQTPPPETLSHTEQYLLGYEGLPYPIYQYCADGSRIHYLSNPLMLWTIDMTQFQETPHVLDLPNYVWDFLVLPSGDVLIALIKETMNNYAENSDWNTEQFTQENSFPSALQEYWEILSADLYLYPKDAKEGHLLYKNLQNLISMEYDEETGRILLETYENQDKSQRRCILLEL